MVDGEGAYCFCCLDNFGEGDEGAFGGGDVEFGEDGGVFIEFGKGFYDHVVLVHGPVDLRDFII